MQESMKNAISKYNKTKEEASNAGVAAVHGLNPKIHPMLLAKVDKGEQIMMDLRTKLKNYKPRQSSLEIGIIKSKDEDRMAIMQ